MNCNRARTCRGSLAIRVVALAAVVVALGLSACAPVERGASSPSRDEPQVSALATRPAPELDGQAPQHLETAVFGLG